MFVMFQKILTEISKEFSGKNAKELIGGIANFHRIQSSPGFREAAEFCNKKLKEHSIPFVKIHKYPAKGNNKYWGCPVPKEWSIKSASLELVEPTNKAKILCRFFESPCSVIQRSKATGEEGISAEVIILPKGLSENEMKKYDIKNKFILTDDPDLKKIRLLAINKLGAAGIIYDLVSELPPVRTRENFPTARRYTSFWYGTEGDEGDAFGFVLSSEQGNQLRNLIKNIDKETKKEGKKQKHVKLHAKIDASFYDGEMEVVDFTIPGKIKGQEILAVAHLCHPKPGAVDNASGCGTLIEIARTLNSLIESGKLEKPKRSIRFLLMAEFTGTFCYLASNEKKIENFVAALNTDMVGADQSIGGGRTLVMERTHDACPSYVNEVLSAILHRRGKEVTNFTETGSIATFKNANDQPFSGGSDHAILGFPDIGIGTPMLIQWPDRYYHTGEDTLDKISTDMLDIVGSIVGTYCYFIANAGYSEIIWIVQEVGSKGRERLIKFSREYTSSLMEKLQKEVNQEKRGNLLYDYLIKLEGMLDFRREREILALKSISKLLSEKDDKEDFTALIQSEENLINKITKEELVQVKEIITKLGNSLKITPKEPDGKEDSADTKEEMLIPVKKYRGPITSLNRLDISYEQQLEYEKIAKDHKEMMQTVKTAIFWIDGRRTIAEIAEKVKQQRGEVSIPLLVKIMKQYEKEGIIKLI